MVSCCGAIFFDYIHGNEDLHKKFLISFVMSSAMLTKVLSLCFIVVDWSEYHSQEHYILRTKFVIGAQFFY